jgi:hypothetical protein
MSDDEVPRDDAWLQTLAIISGGLPTSGRAKSQRPTVTIIWGGRDE